jgi:hypothetical protein
VKDDVKPTSIEPFVQYLQAHAQDAEAFLANGTLELEPVYQCLRDSWDIGWPDQGAFLR